MIRHIGETIGVAVVLFGVWFADQLPAWVVIGGAASLCAWMAWDAWQYEQQEKAAAMSDWPHALDELGRKR